MRSVAKILLLITRLTMGIGVLAVSPGVQAEGVPCAACVPQGRIRIGGPYQKAALLTIQDFRHDQYDGLLRRFVDNKGRVCYRKWKNDPAAVGQLEGYLHSLGTVDLQKSVSREQELALYLNAYNALTIWAILREYPLASIQSLNRETSRYKVFDDVELWIGNQYRSLNSIENDVLRPLGDFRIHFALVCAANGCPRLRTEAYCPENIHRQLHQNTVDFFSKHTRFRINHLTKTVYLSPILKWYGEDFGENKYQVVGRVVRYLPPKDRTWLCTHTGWNVRFLGYDWGLNDQCPTVSVKVGRIPYCIYAKLDPLVRACRNESSDIDRSVHAAPPDNGREFRLPNEEGAAANDPGDPSLPANSGPPLPASSPAAEPPLPEPLLP